jgi:hypothetical protein
VRPWLAAQAAGRHTGRPIAHPEEKIEYARLLRAQGGSLGVITAKTGIPKTSLHRYLGSSDPDKAQTPGHGLTEAAVTMTTVRLGQRPVFQQLPRDTA